MAEQLLTTIKNLRESQKKRNFTQTFDLIVILKEIDTKKPENRLNEEIMLPHGKGKESTIVVFSDVIKDIDVKVIGGKEIEELGKNKRAAKKLVKNTDFFLAEPRLMPVIGKNLGQILAPRGKMPKIITGDINSLVQRLKKSVKIKLKDSPVIQCPVGNEKMKDEEIADNIKALISYLEGKLPRGKVNIKKLLLKLTMSKPVELEV